MLTSGKLIITLALVGGLGSSMAGAHGCRDLPIAQAAQTITLAKVVVTPADATAEVIALAPVVVTPTTADWSYASTHERATRLAS